jgi:nicotinamide mononucleotide adenylyltransferase
MDIKKHIEPTDYEVGVIIGRFQTNRLHEGHINLISHVLSNHKKAILILGVSRVQNTKKNPLDFASRKAMIQKLFTYETERSPEIGRNSCRYTFLCKMGRGHSRVGIPT